MNRDSEVKNRPGLTARWDEHNTVNTRGENGRLLLKPLWIGLDAASALSRCAWSMLAQRRVPRSAAGAFWPTAKSVMNNGRASLWLTLGLDVLLALGVSMLGAGGAEPAPPAGKVAAEQEAATDRSSRESFVNFSFDQVDVASFVKLVGDMTGRRFVVSDDVAGKITVVSPMVRRQDVYPLFLSILESVGCSVVREGDVYRVVALPKRETPMAPVIGPEEAIPPDGLITKVFRLENVSASDLRKALEPRITGGKTGGLSAIEDTNHLIVTDTAEAVRRLERIIREVDKPGLARQTEVVPLQFASAEDVANQLNQAMSQDDGRLPLGEAAARAAEDLRLRLPPAPGTRERRRSVVVVASPHSNSLIIAGTAAQIEDLKRIISKMDVDAPAGRGRLNAIFLKYVSAEEAAKSLNSLLARSAAAAQPGGSAQRAKIAIEASVANNALLVEAGPADLDNVRKLVDQLDRPAEQVQILVNIFETTAAEGLNLGVQMAALGLPDSKGETIIQGGSRIADGAANLLDALLGSVFPKGITLGVAKGAGVDASGNTIVERPAMALIEAIRKNSAFNLLSETTLKAQNNKEASVNIVNEIPILKSTIQAGAGTARDVIQNIDRVDVGIKLKLVPHVIPGGEIQMDLAPSIEAVIDPGPSGTFSPTVAKREVKTTVTVGDGETIVIAGLTREDKTRSVEKIPLLGSIPLLGALFRHTVESTEKTDLLILVTPSIVVADSGGEKTQIPAPASDSAEHNVP